MRSTALHYVQELNFVHICFTDHCDEAQVYQRHFIRHTNLNISSHFVFINKNFVRNSLPESTEPPSTIYHSGQSPIRSSWNCATSDIENSKHRIIFSFSSLSICVFHPVSPSVKAVNHVVGAPVDSHVLLECIVEVFPKPLNNWYRNDGKYNIYIFPMFA